MLNVNGLGPVGMAASSSPEHSSSVEAGRTRWVRRARWAMGPASFKRGKEQKESVC